MAVFKTLQSLKDKVDTSSYSGVSRENFVSLKSGENVRLFFRQEVSEDGANYDTKRGAANIVSIHQSPVDFTKKMVCTNDEDHDYKCWACEAARLGEPKLNAKIRVLINVLALQNGDWTPKVLETAYSRRGGQPGNDIIGYAEEYGSITDREYKFSRVGEKLNTVYSLIPLKEQDTPAEDKELDLIDTSSVYREVAYEDQSDYMMTPREKGESSEKASDGSDW